MKQIADVRAVQRASRRIQGWLSAEAVALICWIDEIQKSNGLVGDLFEIGVHHGKSAIVLAALACPGQERLAVCDLFETQERNISRSGAGSREEFERNIADARARGVEVQVFAMASSELDAKRTGARNRIFHIDGGHSADEAFADISLAADVLLEGGTIIVDDPFRAEWPGVSQALCAFLYARQDLCAVAIGFNKIVLTQRRHASMYLNPLADSREQQRHGIFYPWVAKQLPFFDSPTVIYHIPSFRNERSLRTSLLRPLHRLRFWSQG